MKELASLVPQLFYDLIGRIVPGLAFLLIGAILLVDLSFGAPLPSLTARMSGSAAVALGATFAYLLGTLLGAVGMAVVHREWTTKRVAGTRVENPRPSDLTALRPAQISFLYDALQIYNPAAGARLVKLRAEQHMCTALVTGTLTMLVLCAATPRPSSCPISTLAAIAALLAMAASAYLFYVHLAIRSRRLLLNYCGLVSELSGQLALAKNEGLGG